MEAMLADELRRLGVAGVRPQRGGVLFSGPLRHVYRTLLWSRLASRVLLSLGAVGAQSADALYEGVHLIPWEDHVRADGTIAVDASGVNDALRNTQFTAVRVKDAIADRFRDRAGTRPSVDTTSPDLRVNVVVSGDKARIAIDLSGEPLHRRGYRTPGVQVVAPMKETLAAAVLEVAGWRDIAAGGGGFIDPMCGSATIAIEAAMVAGDIAPGLLRSVWGFDGWLGHDAQAWDELLDAADGRCEAGLRTLPPILASDVDPAAIDVATECVKRAGGLVACNPPYGERLSDRQQLAPVYAELAQLLAGSASGWTLAVITSDEQVSRGLGMRPSSTHELYNGRILAPVSVFPPGSGVAVAPVRPAADGAAAVAPDEPARAFENRLRKMERHLGSWARKGGVTCYRVYDADLPDYNIAVDVYEAADTRKRYGHIAEYAAPATVDPGRAARRLEWACLAVASVLGIDEADVFLKRRERQRGSSQYERISRSGVVVTVAENGLRFEVNLSDYLDTGLFLDHRDTRARVREMARGTRFLNLFAYTGSATVYAAAGHARSTTTVDLSTTYLEWAARNLALNGIAGPQHDLVHADVLKWIDEANRAGNRYDLIFCDPPTFSNSKRMRETWDVQRDHVGLITAAAALLADEGTLLFSCNRRKFSLDIGALEAGGLEVRDITRQTIPKDFERTPGVHSCWIVRRA